MSDIREMLALLATHGVDPAKVYGGEPEIVAQDVAYMMAALQPLPSELLRVKYAGESPHKLWALWFERLMDMWGPEGGCIDRLAKITINECVSANRCNKCHGTAVAKVGTKVLVCSACNGSGYDYPTNSARGKWAERLAWCRKELNRIESDAVTACASRAA